MFAQRALVPLGGGVDVCYEVVGGDVFHACSRVMKVPTIDPPPFSAFLRAERERERKKARERERERERVRETISIDALLYLLYE